MYLNFGCKDNLLKPKNATFVAAKYKITGFLKSFFQEVSGDKLLTPVILSLKMKSIHSFV